jgi:UPF0755 protein
MKKRTKALIYTLSLISACAVISASVILAANDAFALAKSGESREFVMEKDTDIRTCAKKLKEEGIITFPLLFRLYTGIKTDIEVFPAGVYTLSPDMSYDEIRYEIFGIGKPRRQIRLTIPEGYTTDEIIELFVQNGIGTRAGFEKAIQSYDFDFAFLSLIPTDTGRKYRLDGYLFPDTYMFYSDSSEAEAIGRMLANFERRFTSSMAADAAKGGYTVDDIVILASMVQSEAYYMSDMAGIASVFRNRLRSGMKYLQSDATALYGEAYDTYKNAGLPPGPISNPGQAALDAAVYPAHTGYYYFLTGKDKKAVFSATYAEHKRAIEKLKKE